MGLLLAATCASAQNAPTLPKMPPPPSFGDPAPTAAKATTAKARKPAKKPAKNQAAGQSDPLAFERPSKYTPAEFDGPRGSRSGGAGPMMSGSGRPGMGMKF